MPKKKVLPVFDAVAMTLSELFPSTPWPVTLSMRDMDTKEEVEFQLTEQAFDALYDTVRYHHNLVVKRKTRAAKKPKS